jgi:hypothetical protein
LLHAVRKRLWPKLDFVIELPVAPGTCGVIERLQPVAGVDLSASFNDLGPASVHVVVDVGGLTMPVDKLDFRIATPREA